MPGKMRSFCFLLFVSACVGGAWGVCFSLAPEPAHAFDSGVGQSSKSRQVPPDSAYSPSFEHDKPRLDFFVDHLNGHPDAMLHVFVYGGRVVKRGEVGRRIENIRNYLTIKKGVDAKRITVKDGGYREHLTVEIYYGLIGRPEPIPTPTVDPQEVKHINRGIKSSKCNFTSARRKLPRR